ncbi:MAG: leucine-rich repeat protein [Eubacterium sp.]|nr:leucine-rich repeat protein [Eubacterium sp.]
MARKVKFPLNMGKDPETGNDIMVRDKTELCGKYNSEKVAEYFINGRLLTWLEDRYYEEEAEQVRKLSEMTDKKKAAEMLPEVFKVKTAGKVDVEAVELRNEKLKKLRDITSDDEILDNVDFVAFSQEELGDLLDDEADVIYLCDNDFNVPMSVQNVRYVGVNNPVITISGTGDIARDGEKFIVKEKGISVEKCRFSEDTIKKIENTMKKINDSIVIEKYNYENAAKNYSAPSNTTNYIANHIEEFEIKEEYGKRCLKKYKGNSKNVIIPNNINKIGVSAFSMCKNIETVVIPDSVSEIESHAFMYCTSLLSIKISKDVTVINASVFYGCEHLANVYIQGNVSAIKENAFNGCYDLTSLYLPDSISEIGEGAFDWCSKIKIRYKNHTYGYDEISALYNTVNNTPKPYEANPIDFEIVDNGGIVCLKKYTGNAEIVKIPDNVNVIGREAFYNCKSVKKIIIPDTVFEIGGWAFSKCENLESVNIPIGVTKIDYNTFEDCKSLTTINLPPNLTEIRGNAFYGCDNYRFKITYHGRTYPISHINILYNFIND